MNRRRFLTLGTGAGCAALAPAAAQTKLDEPGAEVLLGLTGRIGLTNRPGMAAFDLAMLERLPQVTLMPPTPWYPRPRSFTGPLLRHVLAAAQAQGSRLRAVALNDYAVDIPMQDVQQYEVVLAHQLDGKPMAVRDKGPLFIMYPFERDTALRSALYYSRCVWQLQRIEVL